ncbi:unnamed protein product, partial [Ectocarpus sp. 8 AP-2014]
PLIGTGYLASSWRRALLALVQGAEGGWCRIRLLRPILYLLPRKLCSCAIGNSVLGCRRPDTMVFGVRAALTTGCFACCRVFRNKLVFRALSEGCYDTFTLVQYSGCHLGPET